MIVQVKRCKHCGLFDGLEDVDQKCAASDSGARCVFEDWPPEPLTMRTEVNVSDQCLAAGPEAFDAKLKQTLDKMRQLPVFRSERSREDVELAALDADQSEAAKARRYLHSVEGAEEPPTADALQELISALEEPPSGSEEAALAVECFAVAGRLAKLASKARAPQIAGAAAGWARQLLDWGTAELKRLEPKEVS